MGAIMGRQAHHYVTIDLLLLCHVVAVVIFAGARLVGLDMFQAVRPDIEISQSTEYIASSMLWVLNLVLILRIISGMGWVKALVIVGIVRALAALAYFYTPIFYIAPWAWGILDLLIVVAVPLHISTNKVKTLCYISGLAIALIVHYLLFIRFARGYPHSANMCAIWTAVSVLDYYMLLLLACIRRKHLKGVVDNAVMFILATR